MHVIRPAKESEHKELTSISFASKGYWKYPKSYFDIWQNELTIDPKYIRYNTVFVYEANDMILGYYSIVEIEENLEISEVSIHKGFWLEHMFIKPQSIGQGIGRKLFEHLKQWCNFSKIEEINILADPHSKGFYEKIGCRYVKEFPSTIPNRTTPWLVYKVPDSLPKTIQ
jgi:GNAT superfamily N-acetyltransferase